MNKFLTKVSNKITDLTKYFNIFFYIWAGISIFYEFCYFIYACTNYSTSSIIFEVFSAILSFALLGALIYALIRKNEKMFILLFSFYIIFWLANSYFSTFNYVSYFGYNSTPLYMTIYCFSFFCGLAAGCIAVCVVLNELKNKDIFIKIIDIAGCAYILFQLVLFVLRCVSASNSGAWYNPIYNIDVIAFIILLIVSIHMQHPLSESNVTKIEDKASDETNIDDTINDLKF